MALVLNGSGSITGVTDLATAGVALEDAALTDPVVTGGVYLGGTGAANYLDDYEEGTFTPGCLNAPSATFSTNIGTYVKIGNQVTVTVFQSVTNYNGGGGDYRISNLPFLPSGYSFGAVFGDNNWDTSLNTNNLIAYTISSYSNIVFRYNSGSNAADVTIAQVGTGAYVATTITYFV